MKLVSVAFGFAFVVVMDKDKSEGVISGLNYHFHSLYLFICLGVRLSLSIYIGNILLPIIWKEGLENKLSFFLRPDVSSNVVSFFFSPS